MKKAAFGFLVAALVFGLTYISVQAQMGQGMMKGEPEKAPQQQYQWGPGMMGYGGYGMGPGMMGYGGYGMGPGMGWGGYGMGPGMMGYGVYGMGPGMGYGGYGMGPGMGWGGYGMGPGMMYQPQMQKFLDETRELRKEIHTKQFEYSEALRNPETSRDTIIKLQKELNDLMLKLQEKAPPVPYGGY